VRDRTYSFISTQDGQDVFLQWSSLPGLDFYRLKEGDTVELGAKGLRAVSVRPSKSANCPVDLSCLRRRMLQKV
jgi:cold shock CspA family protein